MNIIDEQYTFDINLDSNPVQVNIDQDRYYIQIDDFYLKCCVGKNGITQFHPMNDGTNLFAGALPIVHAKHVDGTYQGMQYDKHIVDMGKVDLRNVFTDF